MKKFKMTDEGAERLSSEIVQQAVKEYRSALRRAAYLARYKPTEWKSKLEEALWRIEEVEMFFMSEWCYSLSDVEKRVWEDVIDRMKREEGYDGEVVSQELGKN